MNWRPEGFGLIDPVVEYDHRKGDAQPLALRRLSWLNVRPRAEGRHGNLDSRVTKLIAVLKASHGSIGPCVRSVVRITPLR